VVAWLRCGAIADSLASRLAAVSQTELEMDPTRRPIDSGQRRPEHLLSRQRRHRCSTRPEHWRLSPGQSRGRPHLFDPVLVALPPHLLDIHWLRYFALASVN
jgi:hypothetical protein